MADGKFRDDLYYRLAVVTIGLPALRERPDRGSVISREFASVTRQLKSSSVLSEAGLERLASHPWPGNLRELKHVLVRTVLLTPHPTLTAGGRAELCSWLTSFAS